MTAVDQETSHTFFEPSVDRAETDAASVTVDVRLHYRATELAKAFR